MILQMAVQSFQYSKCVNCGAERVPVVVVSLVRPEFQGPFMYFESAEYCDECFDRCIQDDVDALKYVVTGMKKDTTMRTRMGASRKFERAFKWSQSSPFRLRLRIGPRPAFHGGGATVKVEGAAPFVEPERRLSGPDFHARFSAELVPFLLRVTSTR